MSLIELDDLFRRAIDVMEAEAIPYFIYGGIAVPAWGAVLSTEDVDIVIRVSEEEAVRLMSALRKAGFHIPARTETLLFVDTWFRASQGGRDVDFALGATDFDLSALRRAVRVHVFERTIPIASAEDLILYKRVAYRKKDFAHIDDILVRQEGKLDLGYLREWAQKIAASTGKFEVPTTLEKMLSEPGS